MLKDFRAEEKVVGFGGGEADQQCHHSGVPSCLYGELWSQDGPSGGEGLDLCIPESAHCWQLATPSGGLTLLKQCPAAGWGPSLELLGARMSTASSKSGVWVKHTNIFLPVTKKLTP